MKKRLLNPEQIKFLIENSNMTNQELADKLNVKGLKKDNVSTYKYRARLAGMPIIRQQRVAKGMIPLIKEMHEKEPIKIKEPVPKIEEEIEEEKELSENAKTIKEMTGEDPADILGNDFENELAELDEKIGSEINNQAE